MQTKHNTHCDIIISNYVDAPPRTSLQGTIITLSTVIVFSLSMVMAGPTEILTLVALVLLLSLAIVIRAYYAIHITLFVLLLFSLFPFFQTWPLNLFVPLVIYGAVISLVPKLRHSVGWIRRGRLNLEVIKLIIITAFVSTVSLVVWVMLSKPDIGHHLALVPELPFWVYPFAGIGFAFFNSAMEEIIFRGVVMEALDSALGAGYWSVGIQAIPFATLHFLAGFPNGVLGVMMVLIYGAMLGTIRRLSKGILAPFVAHVAADITIFSILVFINFQQSGGVIT